ncbi:MAG TPA: hypothetical protein VD789_04705 [Thermomicrobiales bacterium]|nr:hypothetical protein [Thermomicrobiales bacterium]
MNIESPPNRPDLAGPARSRSLWSRLIAWFLLREPDAEPGASGTVEMPWRHRWDHLPKRTAGFGFTRDDYRAAHRRAEGVARATLGEERWHQLNRDGFLDVSSQIHPGITYRLRVGRRIEVLCEPGVRSPWPFPYLCINPTYPLPEVEFLAHLYLYVRDREDEIIRVAAPQPWDQELGRTF